jgi:hypothetical protein
VVAVLVGAIAMGAILANWGACVAAARSASAVAAAMTAAAGACVIGLLLFYAGCRHRRLA